MTGEVFTRPAPAEEKAAWNAHCRAQRAYDRARAAQAASDKPLLTRLKARITRRLHRDAPGVLVLPGDLYLGWSTNHVEMTQDLYLRLRLSLRQRVHGCRFEVAIEGSCRSMAELDAILAHACRRAHP